MAINWLELIVRVLEDSAALTRPMAKEADAFLKDPSVVAVRKFVASNLHIFTRLGFFFGDRKE